MESLAILIAFVLTLGFCGWVVTLILKQENKTLLHLQQLVQAVQEGNSSAARNAQEAARTLVYPEGQETLDAIKEALEVSAVQPAFEDPMASMDWTEMAEGLDRQGTASIRPGESILPEGAAQALGVSPPGEDPPWTAS